MSLRPNPAAGRAIAGRKPEENVPGGWIAVLGLALLLAAALFGAYEGWVAHSGNIEVPGWGYAIFWRSGSYSDCCSEAA